MVDGGCMRREVPTLVAVTLGCGFLMLDGNLSRLDGCVMLGTLFLLLTQMIRSRSTDALLVEEADAEPLPHLRPVRAWVTFLLGLLLLIGSSRLLVYGAVLAARELGVSELIIGLTVVAIGTSLPELAATLASALRGHTEIALGNIIGSNLFNLLAVMSLPGIIDPQPLETGVITRDYPAMTFLTLVLAAAIFMSRFRHVSVGGRSYVGRTVGVLLVSMYALYYYLLYTTL
jgi:cation:H+ antiporter